MLLDCSRHVAQERQAAFVKVLINHARLSGIDKPGIREPPTHCRDRLQQIVEPLFLHPATGKADHGRTVQAKRVAPGLRGGQIRLWERNRWEDSDRLVQVWS